MFSLSLPLHPAVVHIPVGLSLILPVLALFVWTGISIKWFNNKTWLVVIFLHLILAGSTYFAFETGEDEEEKVEKVVAEKYIEAHEENADLFFWIVMGSTVITTAAGFELAGKGKFLQPIAILSLMAVLAFAFKTGHSGGELVFVHHASQAYKKSVGKIQNTDEKVLDAKTTPTTEVVTPDFDQDDDSSSDDN